MAERAGNKRDRAAVHILISTGLRNTAVRALQVGDIQEELSAGYGNLLIKVEPEWNRRIPGACKNNIPYYTFTSRAATEAIWDMLEERRKIYGEVKSDEPLLATTYNQIPKEDRRFRPLSMRELELIVKKAAAQAIPKHCNEVTPHTFRKVFESVLRKPLSDGDRLDSKDQEIFMGHILPGSQDNYYDRTKIEKMRERFSKLVFEDKTPPEVESLNLTRKLAKLHGMDPIEVKKRREAELGRSLNLREEEELLESEIKYRLGKAPEGFKEEQKIITEEELEKYIANGWTFVAATSQKIIVKRTLPLSKENSEQIALLKKAKDDAIINQTKEDKAITTEEKANNAQVRLSIKSVDINPLSRKTVKMNKVSMLREKKEYFRKGNRGYLIQKKGLDIFLEQ